MKRKLLYLLILLTFLFGGAGSTPILFQDGRNIVNDIGVPASAGFGVGICPSELLNSDWTLLDGYRSRVADNYGNYQFEDGSIMAWVPWFVYRINHASNPTNATYTPNDIDVKGTRDYPWQESLITSITAANPAVVTTTSAHGRTAGDYIWLSHIESDTNWAPYSGQLYKVGTVGSSTTFNLQTAAGVDVDSSGYGGAFSNATDANAKIIYTGAEADAYAVHRAFIDGGKLQKGFFFDKYLCSKLAKGAGYVASSVDNGLPISTHADHNPITDLTACAGNFYYEAINAAHARDGVDGAVNASSIFQVSSRFQISALAILSLAHGQAATSTANCAWYHATYNYPKGCNNNALKDQDDTTVIWESDGYSNCGKTGSAGYGGGAGNVFAKSTHNGQTCGIADLNGLMWEISLGITTIAGTKTVSGATKANPCVITTSAAHGLSNDDYVMITSVGGMTQLNNKLYKITVVDADEFSLQGVNSSAFSDFTTGGTVTYGTFYVAKPSTAMKTFTAGATLATDHWGATGVAAMMEEFSPVFESAYPNNGFAQRFGSGANQCLSEATSGANWLLTGLMYPKDANGIDTTGTNLFGKDYYYQYIINQLCLISGCLWNSAVYAGICAAYWSLTRTDSHDSVGLRLACYLE